MAQVDALVEGYQAGTSLTELGRQYGISQQTVSRRLASREVLRPKHWSTQAEAERAIELYRQGLSLAQVGAAIGYHQQTVYNMLRRAGVACRDTQGRERS